VTRPAHPFWRRRLVPVAIAVAGLNLLVLLAFTLPRSWRLSRVASRAGSLREEVARERVLTSALKARVETAESNARDVDRFYKEMVQRREEALLPTLQEIETMAHQPGLVAGRRGYTREAIKGASITRVAIRLPLEGSYQNLVGFLEKVERGKRFLTVDKIALSQSSEERGGGAHLLVELSAFFKEQTPVDDNGG
jgi:Tfp pilus assembly protein PilO